LSRWCIEGTAGRIVLGTIIILVSLSSFFSVSHQLSRILTSG
jgi:hypothetical protein